MGVELRQMRGGCTVQITLTGAMYTKVEGGRAAIDTAQDTNTHTETFSNTQADKGLLNFI